MKWHGGLRRQVTNNIPHWARVKGRQVAFFGTKQTCPLCLSKVNGYRPQGGIAPIAEEVRIVGAMRRDEDRCPVCHSLDRTRLTMLFLEKTYGATLKDQRILHVAPEWGLYQYLRRARITHYTPSDLDLYRYRHIRDVKKVDCTSLPFPDNSYDLIICSHVMEHIPDERAALSEFYRVLGPNGRAILQVPLALDRAETDEDPAVTTPEAREARFCQWDHVRLYGRDYASRLETVGFKAEFFNPFEQYADEAETLHLNPLEELYVVRRPGA